MLKFRVRARVRVKVRPELDTQSWDTKRMGTKRLWYEMSGSRFQVSFGIIPYNEVSY